MHLTIVFYPSHRTASSAQHINHPLPRYIVIVFFSVTMFSRCLHLHLCPCFLCFCTCFVCYKIASSSTMSLPFIHPTISCCISSAFCCPVFPNFHLPPLPSGPSFLFIISPLICCCAQIAYVGKCMLILESSPIPCFKSFDVP
jgi:hypothetical protein